MEPAGMAGAIVGGFSGYWDANGGEFVGYGIGDGELTGVEMYITGGPMTVDIAMALIKDDPRVVDGNPCYPDRVPDVGEAALVYGYFLDRRAEVKTGFGDANGAKLYVDAFNAAFETALAAEDWQAAAEAVLLLPEFTTSAKHPTAGARLVDMVKDFEWWQMFREDPVIVPETPAVEKLDKVTAPVLVITGELAPSTDRARADIVEKGVAGAQKVVLPGVDHLAQLATPAVFEALVQEFLQSVRQ